MELFIQEGTYWKKRVGLRARAKALNFLMGGREMRVRSGNLMLPNYDRIEKAGYREGLSLLSADTLRRHYAGSDDVNGLVTGAVAAGHVHV